MESFNFYPVLEDQSWLKNTSYMMKINITIMFSIFLSFRQNRNLPSKTKKKLWFCFIPDKGSLNLSMGFICYSER